MLAVAIFAAAPVSAWASIVVGQGAKGLKLGDPGTKVKQVLGKPRSVQKYAGGESWFWNGYWITVTTSHVVRGIETRDMGQQTSKAIGPGSSLAAFRKAYPSAKCKTSLVAQRICSLATKQAGKTIPTNFVFFGGKVKIIDIGQVGEFG